MLRSSIAAWVPHGGGGFAAACFPYTRRFFQETLKKAASGM